MTALEALKQLSDIDEQLDGLHRAICYLETKDIFRDTVKSLRKLYIERQKEHTRITSRLQDITV